MGGRGGKRFVDFGVIRRDRAHSCQNRQGGVMAVLEREKSVKEREAERKTLVEERRESF